MKIMSRYTDLRVDQRYEDHKANDLPEALGRLGEANKIDDHSIPDELTHKAQHDEGNNKGKQHGEEGHIGITLGLCLLTSRKSLNGGLARLL